MLALRGAFPGLVQSHRHAPFPIRRQTITLVRTDDVFPAFPPGQPFAKLRCGLPRHVRGGIDASILRIFCILPPEQIGLLNEKLKILDPRLPLAEEHVGQSLYRPEHHSQAVGERSATGQVGIFRRLRLTRIALKHGQPPARRGCFLRRSLAHLRDRFRFLRWGFLPSRPLLRGSFHRIVRPAGSGRNRCCRHLVRRKRRHGRRRRRRCPARWRHFQNHADPRVAKCVLAVALDSACRTASQRVVAP